MTVRYVRPRVVARAVLILVAIVAAACQGTATQTSPIFLTDVLTGTVQTGAPGFNPVRTFSASVTTLALTDLEPNTGVAVGVGLGSQNPDGSCSLSGVQVFQALHVGESFTISGVPASNLFCVAVFEYVNNGTGAIPDPLAYTVTFNHH